MKRGYLSEYFKGVAAKHLSAVEADTLRSHQHEFNGVRDLVQILGEPDGKVPFPAKFLYITDDDDAPIVESGTLTWYDARQKAREERNVMRWENRLYFTTNLVTQNLSEGDLLIVTKNIDDSLLVIVAEKNSTIEKQLLWLFGFTDLGHPGFSIRGELETEQLLSYCQFHTRKHQSFRPSSYIVPYNFLVYHKQIWYIDKVRNTPARGGTRVDSRARFVRVKLVLIGEAAPQFSLFLFYPALCYRPTHNPKNSSHRYIPLKSYSSHSGVRQTLYNILHRKASQY